MMKAFHGREAIVKELSEPREDPPQRIVIGAAEWRAFVDACRAVGTDTSGDNYWKWRLREAPFAS